MFTTAHRSSTASTWLLSILLLGGVRVSHADIKVGSYAWQHKYDGNVSGTAKANIYGGGYNHIDISWTWTMEEGMQRVNQDWTTAADCLDDNPTWYGGHTGMQSSNYMLKKTYPTTWARIKAHSDAGRYDGSELAWSEGYFDFGGDEYYLRNYYISTRFCVDNFGYAPLVASGYDLDAPCWTQPKIQTYVSGRSAENPTGLGFVNHFTWSWDCMKRPNGWTNHRWTSDDGSTVIVGSTGVWSGDGGGAEICANSAGRFPDFAKKIFAENNWTTSVPNVWNDHLISAGSGFSLFWWGAKMCENRLLEAEKFATFARPFGYRYPLDGDDYMYETWGGFIKFNQHDVADAQGTPWEVIDSNSTKMNLVKAYASALKLADTTLKSSLTAISSNVNTAGDGKSVIVYNALSWARTDYVMVKTSGLGFSSPISVKDPTGAVIPSQVIQFGKTSQLVFTAENVSSLGFKEYKISNVAAAAPASGVTATDGATIQLDNEYCTVKINKTTGAVTSMYDKANAQEMLSGPGNQIASTSGSPNWWDDCCQFYSHFPNPMPGTLPAYLVPDSVRLVDNGPALARVRISYRIPTEFDKNITTAWDHDIILFSKSPVAHNKMIMRTTDLMWNHELVLNLPLSTAVSNGSKEWNAGVAYGHQKYVNKAIYTPTHKWANVANDAKSYSVSLLENNCTIWSFYGVGGSHDLRLVLLAEQTNRWKQWGGVWGIQDWEMDWGLWGHPGDWTDGAAQKGYEFNSPLIARVENSHGGSLPKQYSFLTVEPENIVVTAVKKWESESPTRNDSLTMQVRFYEIDGKNTNAVLKFPSTRSVNAWESMGSEYGVYGDKLAVTDDGGMQKVAFTTGHNQIRSLKVQMPYTGSTVSWDTPRSSRVIGGNECVAVRLCNAKGQTVWQGQQPALRQAMARFSSANGIYFVQYLTKSGSPVLTRKVCGAGYARSGGGME